MSWFRRNNSASYMQNTQTVSRPVGIVLTILTILVIGAAIYCLFLGGRWMFKNLDGSNIPKTETASVEVPAETPQDPSGNNSATSGSGSGATSGTANSGSSQSANTSGANSVASMSNSTSSTSNSAQSNSIASAGPTTTEIPATGSGNVLAIFAVSAMLGLIAHSLYIRKIL